MANAPEQKLGGHPKFYEFRKKNEALYSAKHYQYATDADPMSNFRLCGQLMRKLFKPGVNPTIAAALTLMSKQIVGVYEIVGEGKTGTIESLEDKLRDIEIYATILQVLVDETKHEDDSPNTNFPFGHDTLNSVSKGPVVEAKITHYQDLVADGPYCDDCEQLADFESFDHSEYLCSNCLREKNLNPHTYFTLER